MRARRRAPAVAAAVLAVLTFLVAVPATGSAAAGGGLLTLVERTAWIGDGLDFVLSVRVDGAPADSRLRLVLHDRVRSRSEFARSLTGDGLRRQLFAPAPVSVTAIDREGDGTISLGIPLAREGVELVRLPRDGVYPVVVELLDPDDAVLDTMRTHLVRLPALDADSDAVPLGVVVVVPVRADPSHVDPRGPTAPDVPLAELAGALRGHPGVPVSLTPTPEVLAAASATDPAGLADFAAAAAGREILTSPWVELDETAWAEADAAELDRQLDLGRETLDALLGPGVETEATENARLAPERTTVAAARTMVEHGATALVVPEVDLEPIDTGDFPITLTRPFALALEDGEDPDDDVSTVPALMSDQALVALAEEAVADPVLAAHHILADLAVLAGDEPSSSRVATLALPEPAASSAPFIRALLAGLEPPPAPPPPPVVDPATVDPALPPPVQAPVIPAAAPILAPTTVAGALEAVDPAAAGGGAATEAGDDEVLVRRLVNADAEGSVEGLARAVRERRADVASYRSVFGPADGLAAGLEDVVATAAAATFTRGERDAALNSVVDTINARLATIRGPERQQVTLTARQGRIQLLLTNDAGQAANVTLVLRGDRLVLPDAPDGRLPVRLEAGSNRVELRVEARSSGDAPLDIQLTTPDSRFDLGSSRMTVRATAVSGVGILLMVAAIAFLAVWWTRTIVREHRAVRRRHPAHRRRSPGEPRPRLDP